MPSLTKISKFISLVLRHRPEVIGLNLDENGWANIAELIQKTRKVGINITPPLLQQIVETSDKQRFSISPDDSHIRANQGHSLAVNLGLPAAEPPEILYHGTARRNLAAIRLEGIKRGKRNHVHLSMDMETALKVAVRHGQPAVLTVQTAKMFRDGIRFFRSENGVWLTEYVAPEYLLSEK